MGDRVRTSSPAWLGALVRWQNRCSRFSWPALVAAFLGLSVLLVVPLAAQAGGADGRHVRELLDAPLSLVDQEVADALAAMPPDGPASQPPQVLARSADGGLVAIEPEPGAWQAAAYGIAFAHDEWRVKQPVGEHSAELGLSYGSPLVTPGSTAAAARLQLAAAVAEQNGFALSLSAALGLWQLVTAMDGAMLFGAAFLLWLAARPRRLPYRAAVGMLMGQFGPATLIAVLAGFVVPDPMLLLGVPLLGIVGASLVWLWHTQNAGLSRHSSRDAAGMGALEDARPHRTGP